MQTICWWQGEKPGQTERPLRGNPCSHVTGSTWRVAVAATGTFVPQSLAPPGAEAPLTQAAGRHEKRRPAVRPASDPAIIRMDVMIVTALEAQEAGKAE